MVLLLLWIKYVSRRAAHCCCQILIRRICISPLYSCPDQHTRLLHTTYVNLIYLICLDAALWIDNDDGTLKKYIKNTRNTIEWYMLHRTIDERQCWSVGHACTRLTCPRCSAQQCDMCITTHNPRIYYDYTHMPRPQRMHTISIYKIIITRIHRVWSMANICVLRIPILLRNFIMRLPG